MNKFMKDNIFLMLGVSLPLVLVGVFAVSKIIPSMTVPDPQYSFVFESNSYLGGSSKTDVEVEFIVRSGRIVSRYKERKDASYYRSPRLYIFDAATQQVRKISYPTPDYGALSDGEWGEFKIDELTNLKISNAVAAPDGYKYVNSYRSGRGALNIFRYSSGREVGLRKDSRLVKIDDNRNHGYYNTRFVGWILNSK